LTIPILNLHQNIHELIYLSNFPSIDEIISSYNRANWDR